MKIVPTYVYIYTCGHNGTIKFVCGHNGTADTTGRTSRSVMSACGHNGTMKIHRGHNGTADTTGRTSRSVVSACGHNGTMKFACGHNGTADTTGRNMCSRPCTRCGPSGLLTLYRILLLSLMIITTEHNRCKFVICYDVEKKNRCTIYRQSNKYPIIGCGVPGDALAVGKVGTSPGAEQTDRHEPRGDHAGHHLLSAAVRSALCLGRR